MNIAIHRLPLSYPPIALRFFTEVACGWPSPAADYEEKPLSLDELVNVTAASTYLVPATDNGMLPLIGDGDVLVVHRGNESVTGDVVVASIHDECTIRRLGAVQGRPALTADDRTTPPIVLGDGESIEVWGLVLWNLRQLYRHRALSDDGCKSLDELANVSAYSTFLVRARGKSMAPLILDGDVLVVDRSIEAAHGDIVVAVYQGDFTVKRLGLVKGRDALIPENRTMAPIFVGGDEHVDIWGVAVWNLHRLQRNHAR